MRHQPRTTTLAIVLVILGWASSAAAAGPPFELSVKRDRLIGGSNGTLVFGLEAIEYRTTDTDDARRWAYEDVKQVQVLSPTRIAVLTYEDRGLLKLGADRAFDFTVVQDAVSPELVTFLLERISRPVVTAVMPEHSGDPLSRVRVKHQRQGRGSEGTLMLYDRQLVYVTERADDSRYWRFGDIYSVLLLDRSRLQITAYEGGGGDTRTFVFELKSDLPDGFYDALWARVNPSSLDLARATGARLATVRP
ncbi:MAG TPA: hypothetical protein VI485_12540 [Vicinamibacterales bacterium]|nr:hypothetical protein [Vicinamibacterales bacterium]